VRYYKGLGTSTERDVQYYFTNLDRHTVPFRYTLGDAASDDLFELAFGKSNADAHRARPPQQCPEAQDEPDDDGAVRPRDRGQVAQGAALHRGIQLVGDSARVANREAGQQGRAVSREGLHELQELLA
jgi:hypothetical protein